MSITPTKGAVIRAPDDWRDRPTITVPEAAAVLGIGSTSAYIAAKTGELPSLRIGARVVVPVAKLLRLIGEQL